MLRTRNYSGLAAIGFLYYTVFLAQNLWRSTFPNHAITNLGLAHDEFRILLALTFIPGIFAFSFSFVAARFALRSLFLIACLLVSIGLCTVSFTSDYFYLSISTLCIASGFTLSYIVANSAYLADTPKETTPLSLARLKSLGPIASFTGALIILLIFAPTKIAAVTTTIFSSNADITFQTLLEFLSSRPDVATQRLRDLLAVTGLATLLIGFFLNHLIRKKRQEKKQARIKLSRRLTPYYLLNFLAGCRSAIFQAFALFVLIKQFQLPLHGTAFLGFCAYLCGFFGYRVIGWLLYRYSASSVLTFIYLVVALNFVAFYALLYFDPFINKQYTLLALSVLFLIDSTFFGVSVVTDSHLKETNENAENYMSHIAIGLSLFSLAAACSSVLSSFLDPTPEAFLLGTVICILAIITGRYLKSGPA